MISWQSQWNGEPKGRIQLVSSLKRRVALLRLHLFAIQDLKARECSLYITGKPRHGAIQTLFRLWCPSSKLVHCIPRNQLQEHILCQVLHLSTITPYKEEQTEGEGVQCLLACSPAGGQCQGWEQPLGILDPIPISDCWMCLPCFEQSFPLLRELKACAS